MTRSLPLLAVLAGGCLSLDGQFFPATRADQVAIPYDVIPADLVEEVRFETADGLSLSGAWARQDTPRPPLIFFHGDSGNLGTNWGRVESLWGWGLYDVFVFDYRGYGKSEGDATVDGVLETDGEAAAAYVAAATGFRPEDIPWYGLSLGAAVATHTNDEVPARAVVLESMFASADAVLDANSGLDLPPGWFFTAPLDNVAAIADLTSPVFVIHGLADDEVDPASGPAVYAAAPDPKELWQPEGVGHADIDQVIPDEWRDRVTAFLADPPG